MESGNSGGGGEDRDVTSDTGGGLEQQVCGGWLVKAGKGGVGYDGGGGGGGENAKGSAEVKAGRGGVS